MAGRKYWLNGRAFEASVTAGRKYWLDGLAFSSAVTAPPEIQELTGAAGIGSAEAFGTGGILAGPITGTAGIASAEAFGGSGGFVGAITGPITGTAGIESAEAFGTGGTVIPIQELAGSAGIASAEAFGAGGVGFDLAGAAGIASAEAFGSGGFLLRAATWGHTVFLGGADRTGYVQRGIRIGMQVSSRANAALRLVDPAGAYRPTIGEEVIVVENATGRRLFYGFVDTTRERHANGTPACTFIDCGCLDYGSLLDRRIVGWKYQNFSPIGIAVDLISRYLLDLGVTLDVSYPASMSEILPEVTFGWVTATEAFNQIAKAANCDWRMDFGRKIHFFGAAGGYEAAPFAIADDDGNWSELEVERSRARYWNRAGAKNSGNTRPLWTDSVSVAGGSLGALTSFPLTSAPYVTLDGAEQTVVEIGETGSSSYDWYWISGGYGVWRKAAGAAGTLQMIYPSPIPPVAWAEDAEEIAARGKYEHVEEVRDYVDIVTLQQIADASLELGKSQPATLTVRTRRSGCEPGQVLTVGTTYPQVASGTYLIESVDGQEVDQQFFQWTLRASAAQLQRAGSGTRFFQRVIEGLKRPLDKNTYTLRWSLAETVEGLTNPGLTTGAKTSSLVLAPRAGVARDVTLRFQSVDGGTPTTSVVRVNILRGGVTIFPAAAPYIEFPAGGTGTVTLWRFASDPLAVAAGDVFTINVTAADAVAKDGTLELTVCG